MKEQINVLIADDHKIFRNGFKLIFSRNERIRVIGEAANGIEVVQLAAKIKPDVILMDIQMPIMDGIEATKALKKSKSKIPVIALSTYDENIQIKTMIKAGAKGYLLKHADDAEVEYAIEEVLKGYHYYSDSIAERIGYITSFISPDPITLGGIKFKENEIKVMRLMCEEYSSKQIAAEMKLMPKTIDWYREVIKKKIGSRTTAGVIVFATKNKIF
ncbi:MAG TPA: response regulator transcription factor [Hanamia sp.]|nr:response regulator transcription factor [Hanamia sp.]